MCIRCSFLRADQWPLIFKAFTAAFADYEIDMSYMNEQGYFNRAIKNGIEFDLSVGVFDGSEMVGFTLIGIDIWKGILSAFDVGTGVVPGYQGKGLAKKMFDFALPKLKERGVKKFVLEVSQKNEPGIKAYQKIGFHITRRTDSYWLEVGDVAIDDRSLAPFTIQTVGKESVTPFRDEVDWCPSWENSFNSIEKIPNEVNIYGAFAEAQPVGLLVYYPSIKWILSLVVKKSHRRQGIATKLVSHCVERLSPGTSRIKIMNLEHSDTGIQYFLNKTGFTIFIRQYEMELDL